MPRRSGFRHRRLSSGRRHWCCPGPGTAGAALALVTAACVGCTSGGSTSARRWPPRQPRLPRRRLPGPSAGAASAGLHEHDPPGTAVGSGDHHRIRTRLRGAALGVEVQTVMGPSGQPAGVGVAAVTPGGPAAKAGLRPGDVITAINGTATIFASCGLFLSSPLFFRSARLGCCGKLSWLSLIHISEPTRPY